MRRWTPSTAGTTWTWPRSWGTCCCRSPYKIGEEAEELSRAMAGDGSAAEEVGDLLFAVVNVARLLHIEPEFALAAATDKFIDRFRRMEQAALAAGRRLEDMTLAEQDAVWDEVKCGKPVGKS